MPYGDAQVLVKATQVFKAQTLQQMAIITTTVRKYRIELVCWRSR